MRYAIILAGGIGSRFWPLSSDTEPKQFLNIASNKPMLEDAVLKLRALVPRDNIYIASNKVHRAKVVSLLKKFSLPSENFLFEPKGKNTLAPIAVLSHLIHMKDPGGVIAVLPCDHFVRNRKRFMDTLKSGFAIADRGKIVTLGISPTRPETGYGYIKVDKKFGAAFHVERFIEKPSYEKALKFIRDKRYFWNSGIFLFRADTMLDEIKRCVPATKGITSRISCMNDIRKVWHLFPQLSIDYAVMEKSKSIVALPADYGWLDMGSWLSVEETEIKDRSGNIFKGHCVDKGSRNILVWNTGQPVATLGVKDIIIVCTKKAILVCSKDKTQDVKELSKIFKNTFH